MFFRWVCLHLGIFGMTSAIAFVARVDQLAITTTEVVNKLPPISTPKVTPNPVKNLFATSSSIGVVALCTAEGNCRPDGSKTKLYFGHADPSDGVTMNKGWCSNFGRGGDISQADDGCLKRANSRIPYLKNKMRSFGIPPEQNIEAFVNVVDVWNQAAFKASDIFPQKYAQAVSLGFRGQEAILWARVESFRNKKGQLSAGNAKVDDYGRFIRGSGLFGICANPRNDFYQKSLSAYPVMSERWRWKCIAIDQGRRMRAINSVLADTH
jgi:hypothetical protein